MHLMDETPDIVEKITAKQKVEETIKKKKKEERITKAGKKGIPEGVQKIGKLYQTTEKENRMNLETPEQKNRKKKTTKGKKKKKTKTG